MQCRFIDVQDWKSRSRSKNGNAYYMRIWRNNKDARFCPVYWLLTYLKYANVTSGPIFGNANGPRRTAPTSDATLGRAGGALHTEGLT